MISFDRTGEVSRGHSTGEYSAEKKQLAKALFRYGYFRSESQRKGLNGTRKSLKEESSHLYMRQRIASDKQQVLPFSGDEKNRILDSHAKKNAIEFVSRVSG